MWACGCLALGLLASPVAAQTAAPSSAPVWAFGASAYWYLLPDEAGVLVPVLTADRGVLHLEGRYNYEDRETASLFIGRAFAVGRDGWLNLTPLIGAAVGLTEGVVPGLEVEATLGPVELYSEAEYLVDVNGGGNFAYVWTEVSVSPLDGWRVGLTGQRTRTHDSGLGVDRGLLAGFSRGAVSIDAYLFNPFSNATFGVLGLSLAF